MVKGYTWDAFSFSPLRTQKENFKGRCRFVDMCTMPPYSNSIALISLIVYVVMQ
jgi:hypothetical protein